MKRTDLINFLAEYLSIEEIDDYCVNGLQIEGKTEISKIVTGVSISRRLFETAVDKNADAVIVHHGIFWKNQMPNPLNITGLTADRIRILMKNDINLFGYHLPLDAHPEIGNNRCWADKLKLQNQKQVEIAFCGTTDFSFDEVENIFCNEGIAPQIMEFGKSVPGNVMICTGSGGTMWEIAALNGIDTFITGEISEQHTRIFEESGINLVLIGHYNSEKTGIIALGKIIKDRFGIDCEFVDVPNPV